MNTTAKMTLAALVVAVGLGWLILDASRPVPDDNQRNYRPPSGV